MTGRFMPGDVVRAKRDIESFEKEAPKGSIGVVLKANSPGWNVRFWSSHEDYVLCWNNEIELMEETP